MRVAFDPYGEPSPPYVTGQIVMAHTLAHAFGGRSEHPRLRPLIYHFPAPPRRDVEWMSHHSEREMTHQRSDVDRALGSQ